MYDPNRAKVESAAAEERAVLVRMIIRQRALLDMPGMPFDGAAGEEFEAIDHGLTTLLTESEHKALEAACEAARVRK